MTRARRFPALFSLILSFSLLVCQSTADPAQDMAARMHRGMNILDDDPIFVRPEAARFQLRHFARLSAAGFDTVRLNLHPFGHMDAAWLATLDRLVKAGLAANLTVILDMHEDQNCARDADECERDLGAVWRTLAERYRGAPDRLLFEILNEPHGAITPEVWNGLFRRMLAIVRARNPARIVVVGPAEMSSMDRLPTLDLPAADRRIIATVHTYTPVRFTLQGARWVPDAQQTGIFWGSDAEVQTMVASFDRVKAWSEATHRPVLLGEFGVYEKAPMEPRLRWIARVARIAEAHGLPWAYWQMDTDFAVYDFKRDAWIAPILKALVP